MSNPTITASSISFGSYLGGDYITLTGTDFLPFAVVTFDGIPATSINIISVTSLTCKTPAHAVGFVDLKLTNTDTGAVTKSAYFKYAVPSIYHTVADVQIKTKNLFTIANNGNTMAILRDTDIQDMILRTEADILSALKLKYILPITSDKNPVSFLMIQKICIAFTSNDVLQILARSSTVSINPDDSNVITTFYSEGKSLLKDTLTFAKLLPDTDAITGVSDIIAGSYNTYPEMPSENQIQVQSGASLNTQDADGRTFHKNRREW